MCRGTSNSILFSDSKHLIFLWLMGTTTTMPSWTSSWVCECGCSMGLELVLGYLMESKSTKFLTWSLPFDFYQSPAWEVVSKNIVDILPDVAKLYVEYHNWSMHNKTYSWLFLGYLMDSESTQIFVESTFWIFVIRALVDKTVARLL